MSSAPRAARARDEQDSLVLRHLSLMRAYSFMVTHTAFPPHSFWTAGTLPAFERTRPIVGWIQGLVAVFAIMFGANVMPMWLLSVVTEIELRFPQPMRQ